MKHFLFALPVLAALSGCGGPASSARDNPPAPGPEKDKAEDEKKKEDVAQSQVRILAQAVQVFRVNNDGRAPTTLEELTTPDPNNNGKPYLAADALLDPWGKQYVLEGEVVSTTTPGGKKITAKTS